MKGNCDNTQSGLAARFFINCIMIIEIKFRKRPKEDTVMECEVDQSSVGTQPEKSAEKLSERRVSFRLE